MNAGRLSRWWSSYGMLVVLLGLCGYYSAATWNRQHPVGEEAARLAVRPIRPLPGQPFRVLVVAHQGKEADRFASEAARELSGKGAELVETVQGEPWQAK